MYPLILGIVMMVISFVAGHGVGRFEGHQQAWSEAYKTNPPSERLEVACLGLWVGEQNKKYFKKESQNAK